MSESPLSDLHSPSRDGSGGAPPVPLWMQYIGRGWRIHPVHTVEAGGGCSCGRSKCDKPGKHPSTPHGLKDATIDPEQCRSWFAVGDLAGRISPRNVAIATGAGSDLIVIDLDVKDGFDGVANFAAVVAPYGGVPETLTAITGSGGRHLYFRYPPGPKQAVKNSDNKIGKHIDVRADGGYVIAAPSRHASGGVYTWEDLSVPVAAIPSWLLDLVNGKKSRPAGVKPSTKGIFAAVTDAQIPRPPMVTFGADGAPIFPFPRYVIGGPHEWVRDTTLFQFGCALRHHGWDEARIAEELHRCNQAYCDPPLSDETVDQKASQAAQYAPGSTQDLVDDENWHKRITFDDKGKKHPTLNNAQITLLYHEEWRGVLGFDERLVAPIYLREPPFRGNFAGGDFTARKYPSRVLPDDLGRVELWLSTVERLAMKEDVVKKALRLAAMQNHVNPVRDYLARVHDIWDGMPRIDNWLADYAGAARSTENALYGSKWLISACARTMQPGCKVDTILVLQGDQGFKKSTLFAALLPDRSWFIDQLGDIHKRADAALSLAGKWIIEISDGAAFKGRDVDLMKSFITSQTDWFRAPYAQAFEEHPRRSVFGMSANPKELFDDPTGARRFWVVEVGRTSAGPHSVELSAIRDQLWGEAVYRYLAGEPWWLTPEQEVVARERQAISTSTDAWVDQIDIWLSAQAPVNVPTRDGRRVVVRIQDVLVGALRLETKDHTLPTQKRVRTALDKLGYYKGRVNMPTAMSESIAKRAKREIYHIEDATQEEKVAGAIAPEQNSWLAPLMIGSTRSN